MIALLYLGVGRAAAADLGTFDGFDVRFDTDLRFLLGARAAPQSPALLADVNADDGDRAFRPGLVSERLDVTAELDINRDDLGFALSANGRTQRRKSSTRHDRRRDPADCGRETACDAKDHACCLS